MSSGEEQQVGAVLPAHPLFGAPLGNYPSDRLRPLIVAAVIVGGGGLLVSATIGSLPYEWAPALAMGIMAIVTALVGWYALHGWNREIILFQYGFTYREGSRYVEFAYSEIDSLRLRAEKIAYFGGLLRRTVYRITVTTTSGEQFTLTNQYRRTAELGAKLQERVYRELRPQIARKLVAGDPIRFSDTLRLSERGLHESGRDLPWGEYGGYQIGSRRLALLDSSGKVWFALPLPEYDNLPLLIDLLKSQQHAASGATSPNP